MRSNLLAAGQNRRVVTVQFCTWAILHEYLEHMQMTSVTVGVRGAALPALLLAPTSMSKFYYFERV